MSDLEAKVREAVTDVLARKTKWGVPNMETRHVAEDVTTAVLAVVERPKVPSVEEIMKCRRLVQPILRQADITKVDWDETAKAIHAMLEGAPDDGE